VKVERIPLATANEVDALRRRGRTDRQIENILGLPRGLLARPYLIDDTEERELARTARRKGDLWAAQDRFWASLSRPKPIEGWRPKLDCVRARPNEAPSRASRRPARKDGN
jgi:hypothetical protein